MWKWSLLIVILSLLADKASATDCSGAITAGGTAQYALNQITGGVRGIAIANIDASTGGGEALCIAFNQVATACGTGSSFYLPPPTGPTGVGTGSFVTPNGFQPQQVSVIAATTGHKFACTWW